MNHSFVFKDYHFEASTGSLSLHYAYDNGPDFTETYLFDFDFVEYDPVELDRALRLLFFVAGVSYYKLYAPEKIVIESDDLDHATANFLEQTYQKGLGEFFYVNQLDPRRAIRFPAVDPELQAIPPSAARSGTLIGIGGGKDSLVSVELLRGQIDKLATWSVNHRPQLTPLIERIGLPHYWVERHWDPQLLGLRDTPGAYNGHIPISAIFACVGSVVAILSGFRDSVVSNEQSANEPTLNYNGVAINHQYSKSQAFEQSYQAILQASFGDRLRYYSFLRPLSELRIAEIFANIGFDTYHDVFSSCNRAFRHDSDHMFWDGTCPKCAFVFLALTPFVSRQKLETLFHGKNLLLDVSLQPTYRQLLGIQGDKPLECVGEIKESRAAMRLAQAMYPSLNDYSFTLPADYDYRALGPHCMPDEASRILQQQLDYRLG